MAVNWLENTNNVNSLLDNTDWSTLTWDIKTLIVNPMTIGNKGWSTLVKGLSTQSNKHQHKIGAVTSTILVHSLDYSSLKCIITINIDTNLQRS